MPWGDQSILDEIIRQSGTLPSPELARLFRRAAVQTGLVETHGRNLPGGDADSQNWRQERESMYGPAWARSGGPLNTKASVARFKQEFLQHYDPGERAWQVAAQVQRPRADLRGRYRDVAPEANRVLHAAMSGDGKALIAAGGSVPGVQGAQNQPMGSEGVVALLSAMSGKQGAPQGTSVMPAPAFAAKVASPAGAMLPAGGAGPQAGPDPAALLAAIRTPGGDVQLAPGNAGGLIAGGGDAGGGVPAVKGGKVTVAAGANRPGVGLNREVVGFIKQVSAITGRPLTIGTGTQHSRMTVNGNVSDHWDGNGADVPLSGRALIQAGQAALIAAGMPAKKARQQTGGLFNVGGYQIIFATKQGGNHFDHLHVGRRSR